MCPFQNRTETYTTDTKYSDSVSAKYNTVSFSECHDALADYELLIFFYYAGFYIVAEFWLSTCWGWGCVQIPQGAEFLPL